MAQIRKIKVIRYWFELEFHNAGKLKNTINHFEVFCLLT